MLVAGLPEDSALSRSLAGEVKPGPLTDADERRMWRLEHHILAAIFDALTAANWQRGGGKGPKPKPFPRPGEHRERVIKSRSVLTAEQKWAALKRRAPQRSVYG